MEGFPGGFICREALICFFVFFNEESWFWHVLAFRVLEGFLFCCHAECWNRLVCHDARHTMVPCRYD